MRFTEVDNLYVSTYIWFISELIHKSFIRFFSYAQTIEGQYYQVAKDYVGFREIYNNLRCSLLKKLHYTHWNELKYTKIFDRLPF